MAASAWAFYNSFKEYMADNTIDLDGASFRISLYQSASDVTTVTQTVISELSGEVAEGNGYSSSGKTLSGVTWAAGASASEMRFDATATIWTASGGTIPNVRYAVIWVSGASAAARYLVAYAALSTAQFTVGSGDTLTVTPSANGIFELN